MRFHLLAYYRVFHSEIILKSSGYFFKMRGFSNETPCMLDVSPDSRKKTHLVNACHFANIFFSFSRVFATVVPMSIEVGHTV